MEKPLCSRKRKWISDEKRTFDEKRISEIRAIKYGKSGLKTCTKCFEKQSFEDFGMDSRSFDGLQTCCKKCRLLVVRLFNQKIKDYIYSIKRNARCRICDYKGDPTCLDFAHFDRKHKARGKISGLSIEFSQLHSMKKINEELKKGEWLCAFCHAIETDQENKQSISHSRSALHNRKKRAASSEFVTTEKLKRHSCVDCKKIVTKETTVGFDFDHVKGEKSYNISSMLLTDQFPFRKIQEEMNKCDLRCKICHRQITIKRMKLSNNQKSSITTTTTTTTTTSTSTKTTTTTTTTIATIINNNTKSP